MKEERFNHRNHVPQVIISKDGKRKVIFHNKKMPEGSFKQVWNNMNQMPKPNSKRQQKLKSLTNESSPN